MVMTWPQKIVFQYHSYHWQSCRRCFPNSRNGIINHDQTQENRFIATVERMRELQAAGYQVIEKWECEDQKTQDVLPKQETPTYPHAILYDFEWYYDKAKQNEITHEITHI